MSSKADILVLVRVHRQYDILGQKMKTYSRDSDDRSCDIASKQQKYLASCSRQHVQNNDELANTIQTRDGGYKSR